MFRGPGLVTGGAPAQRRGILETRREIRELATRISTERGELARLAEETGGSIQNPASAQDLVGIKPTIGLVPNAGVMPLSGNRDVVGPIARTVKAIDPSLILMVMPGGSLERAGEKAGLRIAREVFRF